MIRILRASASSTGGRAVLLSRPGAIPATGRVLTATGRVSTAAAANGRVRVVVGTSRSSRCLGGSFGGGTTAAAARSYHGRAASPGGALSSPSSSSLRLAVVLGAPAVAALCADPTLPRRAIESLSRRARRRIVATARCENPPRARSSRRRVVAAAGDGDDDEDDERGRPPSVRARLVRAVRAWLRAVQLLLTLGPAAALYPVGRLLSEADVDVGGDGDGARHLPGWYLDLCLQLAESSGAAVVKMLQWASSRPDLFGLPFCAVFERLQDRTTPHGLEHTERALREAYGDDWEEMIRLGEVLGSGCIGQVYKATVRDENGAEKEVAIKVMHPGIHGNIDADLDLLRFLASLAESIPFDVGRRIRWLDLPGTVEEFSSLLTLQLDFRTEAENLRRFNENFADDDRIMFPELVDDYDPRRDVLIETFCDGKPIVAFLRENDADRSVRTKLCETAIHAVCRMIFDHNFVHGDLHPGNILVCPRTHRFILLDAGMVTEYDDDDHERIVSILTSFIRKDGRKAGELMIKDSQVRLGGAASASTSARGRNITNNPAQVDALAIPGGSFVLHEEAYKDKIEALTIQASGSDYFMEHLGTYITYICNAASTHHVMMNPAFVSAALAVKVQEGVAIALDPTVEIWRIANPIILQSEFRRNLYKLRDRVFGGMMGLVPRSEDWMLAQDLSSLNGMTL